MTQEALEECEVDVCTSCGGLWVDWFDGDVRKVTKDAFEVDIVPAPVRARAAVDAPSAVGACPRCTRRLATERYVADGSATGAELLRCEECLGVFVSKASGEILASLPFDDAEGEPVAVLEPLPWQRLVALLRRLLGLAP